MAPWMFCTRDYGFGSHAPKSYEIETLYSNNKRGVNRLHDYVNIDDSVNLIDFVIAFHDSVFYFVKERR